MTMSIVQAKDDALTNVPETIRALFRVANVHDGMVADAIGLKRNVVQMRRTEQSKWGYEELVALAEYLGVPLSLFFLPVREAITDAINEYGVLDRFEQASRRSTWTDIYAGQGVRGRAA